MLVFRNEMPVVISKNPKDFFALIVDWIKGSPHTKFDQNDFEYFELGYIENGDKTESLEKKSFSSSNADVCGARYSRYEDNQTWDTYVVFNIKKSLLSIEIRCEAANIGSILPKVHPPHILRQLISWGGTDGKLQLLSSAHNLSQCDVWKAKEIIQGGFTCRKPVVYLSATSGNTHVVNPSLLAKKIFGLAHVVVEPNCAFGNRLELDIRKKHPSYGSVGIFFPDVERYEIMRRYDDEHDVFIEKIQKRLIYLNTLAPIDSECSWHYLEQCINNKTLEEIRNSRDENIDEYIEAFDRENKLLRNEKQALQEEINYLRQEHQRLLSSNRNTGLLCASNENEFFPGETLDLVLEILEKEKSHCPKSNSRKSHLLESLLNVNTKVGQRKELIERIRKCLSNWENKSAQRKELESIGFEITEDGKHLKLNFKGDSRYTITVSKTPSDGRSMKNNASDAINLLFNQ